MLQSIQFVEERATPYRTVADFLRAFNEEMHSLYLLSFLLTADHDKAEQCLISAMGECVDGIGFLMDQACPWARAAVLKQAIQMIKPAPEHQGHVPFLTLKRSATLPVNNPFAVILLLDDFERFVFVMSTLEEQSDEECAILLECSRRDVMMARLLALKQQWSTDALSDEMLHS
jgi:hypothetical protein